MLNSNYLLTIFLLAAFLLNWNRISMQCLQLKNVQYKPIEDKIVGIETFSTSIIKTS